MLIILMGAPGCGKGTQADLLQKKHGLKHVSTGDLLRAEITKGTQLGQEIKKLIDNGDFVSGEVVMSLLKAEISNTVNAKGITLDGYPRTLDQAKALTELLKNNGGKIDALIYLNLEIEEIITRLVSRRQCKKCGNIFNIRFIKNFDGHCPKCGSVDIVQRDDDNEAAAKHRIEVYKKETLPVKEFYVNEPFFHEVNANRGIDEVFAQIEEIIFKK